VVLGTGNKKDVLSAVTNPELIQIGGSITTKTEVMDDTDFGANIPSGAIITGRYRTENGVAWFQAME
jgi:hypothetical protein